MRYDTATGAYLEGVAVGGSLSDITVSADGSTVYVSRDTYVATFDEGPWWDHTGETSVVAIDTASLAVAEERFEVTESTLGVSNLGIAGNDLLFASNDYAGSGWVPLVSFDVEGLDIAPPTTGQDVRQYSSFDVSEDGRYVLMVESNISSVPTWLYDSVTDQWTQLNGFGSGFNRDTNAVSSAAQLAVTSLYGEAVVLDLSGGARFTFETGHDEAGAGFATSQATIAILHGDSWNSDPARITLHSQADGTTLQTIEVGPIDDVVDFVITRDGDTAFIVTTTGVVTVDLMAGGLDFTGGAGADVQSGTAANDRLEGGLGNDNLRGLAGQDVLIGGDGNDTLRGGEGGDRLDGGAGDDIIFADRHDLVTGGDGYDRVYFSDAPPAFDAALAEVEFVRLSDAGGVVSAAGMAEDFRLVGGNGVDVATGGSGFNRMWGYGGDDVFIGGEGRDTLNGGAGNDILNGGDGVDSLLGGTGNDRLDGGTARDRLWGHSGDDELYGGEGNDDLYGGSGNDTLRGGDGDDLVLGQAGADRLYGGAGDDRIYVDADDLVIDGGAGTDTIFVQGAAGVTLDMAAIRAESAIGGAGDDVFDGAGSGFGLKLYGRAGEDMLAGGAGNDLLRGGDGNDVLIASGGNDSLYGDAGADVFALRADMGSTRIRDFTDGEDRLDVSDLGDFSFADVELDQVGADVVVTIGGESVRLVDVDILDIDAADFIF